MQHIQNIITQTIHALYGIDHIPEISPAPKPEVGEYCIGVFQLTKIVGKAPNIIANEIAWELQKYDTIFLSTNSIGGYVNFFLTNTLWWELLNWIYKSEKPKNAGKTIVVDYIGANAGKPLHIWHLCTPSVGQSICNIYDYLGYKVIGDSHFGDWGGIFGKLIYGYKKWENNNNLSISYLLKVYQEVHTDIIKDTSILNQLLNEYISKLDESVWPEKCKKWWYKNLVDGKDIEWFLLLEDSFQKNNPRIFEQLRVVWWEFKNIEWNTREEFKKLSQWDSENVELWKTFTGISITEIEKKLELLNVHAKYNIGESFYEWLGLPRPNNEDYPELKDNMKAIVAELIEKWIATDNSILSNWEDKSVGVVFPEEMKLPSCILQKKDGTGLYLTSDLAAIKYRLTNGWNPSKLIYSVDVRQQLHLRQAFAIAKMAWPELTEWVEFFHAFNGFIKLKEWAMSTRHGTVIFLEKLIEEGEERTKKILSEKGRILSDNDIETITVAAIKYSYLAQDREKDVVFDWDKALAFEWNSGPYIQYAYVRAKKILPEDFKKWENFSKDIPFSEYDKKLIQILLRKDAIIQETASKYKPHILANYVYEVATTFNSFYVHTPKILEETNKELKNIRLGIILETTENLKCCFHLLGIHMPTEM